jgi:CDP-diacylglycerol--glycerol-3-phosphate 3-phosphatidyltransferase
MEINLPNKLTLSRVALVPVFVTLMSFQHAACYIGAYLVFIAATLTDYYDGKIARERNLVTNFGKLFDPVADKILITAAFLMLMKIDVLYVPAWTIVIIIGREFLVTGARSLAASDGVVIAANVFGKLKTILQMTYVFVFLFLVIAERAVVEWFPLWSDAFLRLLRHSSFWAIIVVALFTAYSGVQFAYLNWRTLGLGKLS